MEEGRAVSPPMLRRFHPKRSKVRNLKWGWGHCNYRGTSPCISLKRQLVVGRGVSSGSMQSMAEESGKRPTLGGEGATYSVLVSTLFYERR